MDSFDYVQSDEMIPFEYNMTPAEIEAMFIEDANRELREIASEAK